MGCTRGLLPLCGIAVESLLSVPIWGQVPDDNRPAAQVLSLDPFASMPTLTNPLSDATPVQSAGEDVSSTRVSIESTVDMDSVSSTCLIQGKETKVVLKGRCTRCWGNLLARHDETGRCTRIRCRVCGFAAEGEKAADELLGMQKQTALNLMNLQLGRAPQYHDGEFVEKIFPLFEALSKKDFTERVQRRLAERKDRSKLTRHDFPPGSPGLLFIQARILLVGVAALSNPDEIFVGDVPDVRVMDDGTLGMSPSQEGCNDDLDCSNNRLWNRIGTTMIEAMSAVFACELAMKAICLACTDEAPKSHDLIELHDSLPETSKERIAADYPQIAETLGAGRHTFGRWRYFEVNVGEAGMRAMLDVPHAHALGKAARVILDEGEMVGLSATIDLKATHNVHIVGDTKNHNLNSNITVKGREAALRSARLSIR